MTVRSPFALSVTSAGFYCKLADRLTRKQAIHRAGGHLNRSVVLQVAGSVHAAAAARELNI